MPRNGGGIRRTAHARNSHSTSYTLAAVADTDIHQDTATVEGQYKIALQALRELRKLYGKRRSVSDPAAFLRILKVTLLCSVSCTSFSPCPRCRHADWHGS